MARKLILLGSVGVAVVFSVVLLSNPLRRSEEAIGRWLEKTTPLGSGMLEVRAAAMRQGWCEYPAAHCDAVNIDDGLIYTDRPAKSGAVAAKYMRGHLGSYQGLPWRAFVAVFWEFDEEGRLVAIQVWKTRDTL